MKVQGVTSSIPGPDHPQFVIRKLVLVAAQPAAVQFGDPFSVIYLRLGREVGIIGRERTLLPNQATTSSTTSHVVPDTRSKVQATGVRNSLGKIVRLGLLEITRTAAQTKQRNLTQDHILAALTI